jgi:hypothetical protein
MAQTYRGSRASTAREHAGFNPSELTGAEKAAQRPGGIAWPQLRIGRKADINDPGNAEVWDAYINLLARRNSHRGTINPLGSVACNMVLDTEMRTMIGSKYPGTAHDIRKAKEVYRAVAKDIGSLLGRERYAHDAFIKDVVYRERPDLMGMTSEADRPNPQGNLWADGYFDLRPTASTAFGGYDGNKIALDLSANEELYEERRRIIRFLQTDLRFDARTIARADWQPHVTLYQANAPLNTTNAMPNIPEDIPRDIALESPKAHLYNA